MVHAKKMWFRAFIVGSVCLTITFGLSAAFWQVSKVQVATALETKMSNVISQYGADVSRARMSLVTQSLTNQIMDAKEKALSLREQVTDVFHNDRLLEEDKRYLMTEFSKSTLHASPVILGVYTNFVENALGDDSKFIDREEYASNEKGRFTPYFTVAGDEGTHTQIQTEKDFEVEMTDQFGYADNYWYTCVFKLKRPCLVQPYKDFVQGEEHFMFSLALPVYSLDKSEVVGVVGADIALKNVSQIVSLLDQSIFDGNAEITLLNKYGQVLGDSENPDSYGQLISDISSSPEHYKRLSEAGVPGGFTDTDTGEMLIYTPLKLMDSETVLELFAKIPQKSVADSVEVLNEQAMGLYNGNVLKFMQIEVVVLLIFLVGQWYCYRRYLKRRGKV